MDLNGFMLRIGRARATTKTSGELGGRFLSNGSDMPPHGLTEAGPFPLIHNESVGSPQCVSFKHAPSRAALPLHDDTHLSIHIAFQCIQVMLNVSAAP